MTMAPINVAFVSLVVNILFLFVLPTAGDLGINLIFFPLLGDLKCAHNLVMPHLDDRVNFF